MIKGGSWGFREFMGLRGVQGDSGGFVLDQGVKMGGMVRMDLFGSRGFMGVYKGFGGG